MSRNDVIQDNDVAVNDLSYNNVSLNKRENKNIILIIFKLHVSFYYEKNDDVAPGDVSFDTMSCHDMSFDDITWAMVIKGYRT